MATGDIPNWDFTGYDTSTLKEVDLDGWKRLQAPDGSIVPFDADNPWSTPGSNDGVSAAASGVSGVSGYRDFASETRDTLRALLEMAPEIYEAESKYRPLYADLDYGIAENQANKTRDFQLNSLQEYGPQAVQAFLNLDPEVKSLLNKLTGDAMQGSDSEISKELERVALEELKKGGELTDEELRNVQQASRSAWTARGLIHSNPAVLDEIVKSDAYSKMRKDQRRGFAEAIENMRQNRIGADRAFSGKVLDTRTNLMRDPMSMVVQNPVYSLAYGRNQQFLFDPMNNYASQVNSQNASQAANADALDKQIGFSTWQTQYQGDLEMQIANMEADAARESGLMSMFGDIGGSAMLIPFL